MASGDAQKVWFPELIAIVRQAGDPAMSMDALLRLRDRLLPGNVDNLMSLLWFLTVC